MINTVFKLLVTVAILNALARGAVVAWDYYQLRDDALQLITFGALTSTTDLHKRILLRADELDVPLRSADLDVRRDGTRTHVEAFYTQPVELFPSLFYPLDLSFALSAFAADIQK